MNITGMMYLQAGHLNIVNIVIVIVDMVCCGKKKNIVKSKANSDFTSLEHVLIDIFLSVRIIHKYPGYLVISTIIYLFFGKQKTISKNISKVSIYKRRPLELNFTFTCSRRSWFLSDISFFIMRLVPLFSPIMSLFVILNPLMTWDRVSSD